MAIQIGSGTGVLATYLPDLTDTANIQTALKQLYYGTTAGTLSQTTGIYGALYTLYTGDPTLAGNVTITGNLTVNGTTTTINSTTVTVDDLLLELGAVASPTNTTANGGGISILAGAGGDKKITWDSTNGNWTTNQDWNLDVGKTLKINNIAIASGTGNALVLGGNTSTSLAIGNTSGTTTINGSAITFSNPNKTMAGLMGYTSTVTSATPVVLTNTSSYYQQFTGSTAQTITLPVTSTLAQGWTFHIVNNNSSNNLTVNSSGGNLVITVPPGTTAMVTCIGTALTTAADWESGLTDFSTYQGSGDVVMATSPTITTPVIDVVNASSATATTPSLYKNITSGTINIAEVLGSTAANGTLHIANNAGIAGGTKTVNIGTGATAGTTTITIGSATGSTTNILGTWQLGSTSVTTTAAKLNYLTAATGTTGTNSTNIVFSASPTFTGTVIIPTLTSAAAGSSTSLAINTPAFGVGSGSSGDITLTTGSAGTSAGNSGKITLDVGTITTGTKGIIVVGGTTASAGNTVTVNVGNTSTTTSVALNTTTAGSVTTSSTFTTGGKFGYTTDGGNVTQLTSKVTGVTLNQLCGTITLFSDALASQTTTSFTFTNSTIASNDIIVFSHVSGGTIGAYNINAISGTGTATVYVRNVNSASLTEAPVFRFIVIKA